MIVVRFLPPSLQRWKWIFPVILIAIGVGIQVWCALQWRGNVDSDETVYGLMTKDILLGRNLPLYGYGDNYGGGLISFLSAPFLILMGPSVLALRMSSLVFCAIFLILHTVFVQRLWGHRVALLSLLFLIVPGYQLQTYSCRPTISLYLYLSTCTATLLLCRLPWPRITWKFFLRISSIGFLVGLSLWIRPNTLLYFVAIAIVTLLETQEWSIIRQWIATKLRALPRIHIEMIIAATVMAVGLWSTLLIFQGNHNGLFLVPVAVLLVLIVVSPRRATVIMSMCFMLLGFLIGNAPQWGAWALAGIHPDSGYEPALPAWAPLKATVLRVLPTMMGIQPFPDLFTYPLPIVCVGLLFFLIIIGSILIFCWQQRTEAGLFVRLSPLSPAQGNIVLLFLLFFTNIIAFLGIDQVNESLDRYLTTTWHAGSIIIAIVWSGLQKKYRLLLGIFIAVWLVQAGFNLQYASSSWSAQWFPPGSIEELEHILTEKKVTRGYADAWLSFPIDYLTEERLIVAPYSYYDRYPSYKTHVAQSRDYAVIFSPRFSAMVPAGKNQKSDLLDVLRPQIPVLLISKDIFERIERSTVRTRDIVGQWDIWILSDPSVPSHP